MLEYGDSDLCFLKHVKAVLTEACLMSLQQSTLDHPVIHPVCLQVLTEVFRQPNVVPVFWKEVVNGKYHQL